MIQGKLIKKYREENNLTIKDLSKLMHVSKNVITLWEDGTKIPREDDITFLCSLYGIDRIDLMNTTDNKTSKKNSRKDEAEGIESRSGYQKPQSYYRRGQSSSTAVDRIF